MVGDGNNRMKRWPGAIWNDNVLLNLLIDIVLLNIYFQHWEAENYNDMYRIKHHCINHYDIFR